MGKSLFIAEKPSVAQEFARALKISGKKGDGFIESETAVVTWCVGHLVTMSYPEKYDIKYKRWSLDTLPFLPREFKYEVIPGVKKQFEIVKGLLNRPDVDTIYVCTDSGREGEYIYRLVAQMAGVKDRTQMPLAVAETALKIFHVAGAVVERGNANAVTDGLVASMMARTAVLSALLNVKINLGSIKDEEFVARMAEKVAELEKAAMDGEKAVMELSALTRDLV